MAVDGSVGDRVTDGPYRSDMTDYIEVAESESPIRVGPPDVDAFSVAVCIAAIPPRRNELARALASVAAQTRPADEIHVAMDVTKAGVVDTRNRSWRAARTAWCAILDDDDEFLPIHLEACLGHAELTGADLVYPGYEVIGGTDPCPEVFGRDWVPGHPVQTSTVIVVKRELLEALDGYKAPEVQPDPRETGIGESFYLPVRADQLGAKISHLPIRTWKWHHWGIGSPNRPGNTSGLPSRW